MKKLVDKEEEKTHQTKSKTIRKKTVEEVKRVSSQRSSSKKALTVEEKKQLIKENKHILKPVSLEEKEKECKYETYKQKKNWQHYQSMKKKKETDQTGQTQGTTAQKGKTQFYWLLKRIDVKHLEYKKVKVLYEYMIETSRHEFTDEEVQWYQKKPSKIRKFIPKEFTRRINAALKPKPQIRQQKQSESQIEDIEQKAQSTVPKQEVQANQDSEDEEVELAQDQEANEHLSAQEELPIEQLDQQKMKAISLDDQKLIDELINYDIKPIEEWDQINSSDSQNGLHDITISEEVEEDTPMKDLTGTEVKADDLQSNEELKVPENHISKLKVYDYTEDIDMNYDLKSLDDSKDEAIQDRSESVEIIGQNRPPRPLSSNPKPSLATKLQAKSKDEFKKPTTNRLIGKLKASINDYNQRQNSSSSTRQRIYAKQPQTPTTKRNNSLLSQVQPKPLKNPPKQYKQMKQNPIRDSDYSDLAPYVEELYEEVKQLYPEPDFGTEMKPRQTQMTQLTLGNQKLKALSAKDQDFLQPQQMDKLITHLKDLSAKYQSINDDPKIQVSYNLDEHSIFLHILSGCGISSLHVQSRVNCLCYGIEENLDATLAAQWFRAHCQSIVTPEEESQPTIHFDKTQFIYGSLNDLSHFAVGDYLPHFATHILMTKTPSSRQMQEIVRILKPLAFRVLIWPFTQQETQKLLQYPNKQNLKQIGSIKCKQYFDDDIDKILNIYVVNSQTVAASVKPINQTLGLIAQEQKNISKQMQTIKQNNPQIPVWKSSRWIQWTPKPLSDIHIHQPKYFENSMTALIKRIIKTKMPQFHQQPSAPKSKNQEQEDMQKYNQVVKALKGEERFSNTQFRKLIFAGYSCLVIECMDRKATEDSTPFSQYVMKVSNEEGYDSLKTESQIAKLISEEIKSKRVMEYRGEYEFQVPISNTKKKGKQASERFLIMYQAFDFNLYDIMTDRYFKDIEVVRFVFAGIALGLREFHSRHFAHCDLKPTNILIDDDMRPVIGDFGQVRGAIGKLEVRGTAPYMPQEYFDMNMAMVPDYDYRMADIWSLGVILYEMVYGKQPFTIPIKENEHGKREYKLDLTTEEYTNLFVGFKVPKESPRILVNNPSVLAHAVDLIGLIFTNMYTRINIDIVVGHPFVKNITKNYDNKSLDPSKNKSFLKKRIAVLNQSPPMTFR